MNTLPSRDPLHGITLAKMLEELLENFGWDELGDRIPIRCFTSDPSISSSLKFLRRTPWAREKVEALYLEYRNSPPSWFAADESATLDPVE